MVNEETSSPGNRISYICRATSRRRNRLVVSSACRSRYRELRARELPLMGDRGPRSEEHTGDHGRGHPDGSQRRGDGQRIVLPAHRRPLDVEEGDALPDTCEIDDLHRVRADPAHPLTGTRVKSPQP